MRTSDGTTDGQTTRIRGSLIGPCGPKNVKRWLKTFRLWRCFNMRSILEANLAHLWVDLTKVFSRGSPQPSKKNLWENSPKNGWVGWLVPKPTPKTPKSPPKLPFVTQISPFVFLNLTKTLRWVGGLTDLGKFSKQNIIGGGAPLRKHFNKLAKLRRCASRVRFGSKKFGPN